LDSRPPFKLLTLEDGTDRLYQNVGKLQFSRNNIIINIFYTLYVPVAYQGIFFPGGVGGVHQIQLLTEDRESGVLEAVALYSGVLEAAVKWYKKIHFI
jgi:hypothetical protein